MNVTITVLLKIANHKKGPVRVPADLKGNTRIFDREGCYNCSLRPTGKAGIDVANAFDTRH
jgi:hypothetical protein